MISKATSACTPDISADEWMGNDNKGRIKVARNLGGGG